MRTAFSNAADATAIYGPLFVKPALEHVVKAAIVVLAGTESHADLGRVVNALEAAKEFKDEGDDVTVIFDGAGTQWVPELEDESHDAHPLYKTLEDHVQVCDYCAGAFHVGDEVDESGAERIAEYDGHPSIRSLVADGYEVITF